MPYLSRFIGWFGASIIFGKIANLYSTRSMTIFLYQAFAFNLTIPLTNTLVRGNDITVSITKSIICFVTTVFICAGFAAVFGNLEKLEIKHFRNN